MMMMMMINIITTTLKPLPSDGLSFRIDVIMNEGVSVLHWHLHDSLDEEASYEFKFKPGGAKVEIILKKAKNTHWTSFGLPGEFCLSVCLFVGLFVFLCLSTSLTQTE